MKPKALLSLLAVTGAVLNGEIAPAQTLPSNVRNLPLDNTLGTPGSSTDLNSPIAVDTDRLQNPAQSAPAESSPQNKVNDVKIPVETRDLVSRVTENLFSALNGIINIQLATFLPIDPNVLTIGSNARLNVGMALVKSANNGTEVTDRQVQQYIANSNNSIDPQLAKNATSQANVERTTSKNSSQPSSEATVGDLTQSKPKSSTANNESGTVGKNNPGETKKVPLTGNPLAAMTLPPLNPILSNENKSSVSSIAKAPNELGTVSKNNPGETKKVPLTGNPLAAMTLPPLNPILSNENKSSVSSIAKATDRVNNPVKIEEARDRDKLALDLPNSSTSTQKVSPSITSANSIQKIAPLDVNLIVTKDLLVKKDDLGDLNIYSADTLGITNSSGISSTSLSQGKAGDLSVISDRMLLKNAILSTKKDDRKENIALVDTSNRMSLACGVALDKHKFTLVGQGGLLANPEDSLNGDVTLQQDSLGIDILPTSHWLCDRPAP